MIRINPIGSLSSNQRQTMASMEKLADTLKKDNAQLWINHDKAQRDGLKMSPEFYD
jgi:N-acyl homoserine lactone hydrolase